MNRHVHLGVHRSELVYWLPQHVEHAAQRLPANRHRDARAGIDGLHAAHHAVGRFHRNATHPAFTQMLLHLHNHVHRLRSIEALAGNMQRLENGRHFRFFELHIHGRPADANHFADIFFCHKPSRIPHSLLLFFLSSP